MRTLTRLTLVSAALAAGAAIAGAQELEGWHRSPDDAVKAARKSGKPILVVTCWKKGV